MTVQEWIDGYGSAWEARDPEAAGALFTEGAVYRDHPLGEPHTGRDGVRSYWGASRQPRTRFAAGLARRLPPPTGATPRSSSGSRCSTAAPR